MARTGQNCIGTEIFMSIAVLAPSTSASSTAVLELKSCSEEMQDCSLSNRVLYSLENKYKILVLHFPPLSKENFLESLIGKGISEMSQKWWPLLPTSDFHEQYYCCFPGLSLWHPGRETGGRTTGMCASIGWSHISLDFQQLLHRRKWFLF